MVVMVVICDRYCLNLGKKLLGFNLVPPNFYYPVRKSLGERGQAAPVAVFEDETEHVGVLPARKHLDDILMAAHILDFNFGMDFVQLIFSDQAFFRHNLNF